MRHTVLAATTALALTTAAGHAQTVVNTNYIGSFNGSYTAAPNWDTGMVPNNTSTLAFDINLDRAVRLTAATPITINAMHLDANGSLELDAATAFTATGAVTGIGRISTRDPLADLTLASATGMSLSRLETLDGNITANATSWTALNGGEILRAISTSGDAVISMPNLTSLSLAATGPASVGQATVFGQAGAEVGLDLSALTTVNGSMDWYATFGSFINAPALQSLDDDSLIAEMPGTVAFFDGATSATNATLLAESGGELSLTALTTADGALIQAHGAGSMIQAPNLAASGPSTMAMASNGGHVALGSVQGLGVLSVDATSSLTVAGDFNPGAANANSLFGTLTLSGDGTFEASHLDEGGVRGNLSFALAIEDGVTTTMADATDDNADGIPDAVYLFGGFLGEPALTLSTAATLQITDDVQVYLLDGFMWVPLADVVGGSEGCFDFGSGQICFGAVQEEETFCAADLNQDGMLDNDDIRIFIRAYIFREATADFDGNGRRNVNDIRAFLNAYLTECGTADTGWNGRGVGRANRERGSMSRKNTKGNSKAKNRQK